MKGRTGSGVSVVVGLVVLLAACASSGPDPAEDQLEALRAEIRATVIDQARATAMLGDVDEMERLMVKLGSIVVRHDDEVRNLVRDYGTTRSELEAEFERFLDERQRVAMALAEAHYRLKAQATAEEWKKLAKKEGDAIDWVASRHIGEVPLVDGGE